jgi:hypothetical protein
MRNSISAAFVGLCAASILTFPASAASAQSVACAGDTETISWTAPADTSGLTGYEVENSLFNGVADGAAFPVANVPLDQTSASVTLDPGYNNYLVYPVTAEGVVIDDIGGQSFTGGTAPCPNYWTQQGVNTVGKRTATVTFNWGGIPPAGLYGYIGASETVSDGNTTVTVSPGQPATFTGLKDGVGYTFRSDTFNACGSSSSAPNNSPVFVPGAGPVWTSNSPPLTAPLGLYAAPFHASGDPRPTYELVGAPSWLQIAPNLGLVYGLAPPGTTSFSYAVTATNGVGIQAPIYPSTDITAGPFTVSVKR